MKKIIGFLVAMLPAIAFGGYFDVQSYSVVPDTTNVTNDFYYRGGFHVGFDTFTVRADSLPSYAFEVTPAGVTFSTTTIFAVPLTFDDLDVTYGITAGTITISGVSTFTDTMVLPSGLIGASNWKANDNIELAFGNGADFYIGYSSTDDELRVGRGSVATTDANVAFRVTASTVVAIGDAGTMNYVDGSGDLYVEDELEVDGNALFSGSVFLYNPVKCYWSILMTNTRPIIYGTDSDFGEAYYTTNDEYRFFRGGSLSTDANVAFRVTASTVVAIGDAGTINYANGSGDFFVEGDAEIGGISYLSTVAISNNTAFAKAASFHTAIGGQYYGAFKAKADDGLHFVLGGALTDGYSNNNLIIGKYDYIDSDYDHDTLSDDPKIFIQSSQDPDIDNTQWFSLSYSSANDRGEYDTGGGGYQYSISGTPVYSVDASSMSVYVPFRAEGTARFESTALFIGTMDINSSVDSSVALIYSGGYSRHNDNIESVYGATGDFCLGFVSATDEFRLASGTDVTTDGNRLFTVKTSTATIFIPLFAPNMKTGADQASAGAAAGETWADSDDGYTIKLGQ